MKKDKKRVLSLKVPARFRMMRVVLFVVAFSAIVNAFLSIELFKQITPFTPEIFISYLAFQMNFVTVLIVVVISLVWILHHGFGALSRMEVTLDKVLEGERSLRLKLRKNDTLKTLAEKINRLLDELEK